MSLGYLDGVQPYRLSLTVLLFSEKISQLSCHTKIYHNIVGEIGVFIISQAYAITTTSPVTVVCSGALSFTMTVTIIPSLMRLPVTFDQHDVVVSLMLMLRDTRGVVGLTNVPQQQPES